MKTVMIVDDELLARLGIKSLIDWEALGYRIVHEAENGRDALEFAQKSPPDIVITDVKMPVMDGISLIQNLKQLGVPSKIIVMSAYEDFSYVKNAMRDGADDYLLKLELEPDFLKDALLRISKKIDNEIPKAAKSTVNCQVEDFLKPGVPFLCAMLRVVSSGSLPQEAPIEDMLRKALLNEGGGMVFSKKGGLFLLLIQSVFADDKQQKSRLARLSSNIKEMSTMLFDMDTYLGFSLPQTERIFLNECCAQAEQALNCACFSKSHTVHYSLDSTMEPTNFTSILNSSLTEIEASIRSMNTQKIDMSFQGLLKSLSESSLLSKKYLSGVCYTLIFLGNFLLKQTGGSLWVEGTDPYSTLKDFEVREQYLQWVQNLRDNIAGLINPESENQRIIMEAKKCIQQNYDKDISLNFMSEYLCLSPNYFSKLFKKHTGQGFVDYLTDLRIHRSIELLQSGKYKVYEVAELVGYDTATYFSQIFKKKMGCSPYTIKSQEAWASNDLPNT